MSTDIQSAAQAAPRRTDPVIVRLNCEATPSNDTQTIDRAEWDDMTPAERAERLDDMVQTHIGNAGGGGWHIADREDEAAVGYSPSVGMARTAMERWDSGATSHVDTLLAELRAALGMRPKAERQEAKPEGEQPATPLDGYVDLVVAATRELHSTGGTERHTIRNQVRNGLLRKGQRFDESLFAQALTVAVDAGKLHYLGYTVGDARYQAPEATR